MTEHGAGPRYAAFISYNRAVDLDLSADLQRALQRFAKPWYRLRALRVFRDLTVLSANSGAWAAVARGLDDSEYLILLAAPRSAASEWVRREIRYWLEHKPRERILIALTDGELVWDAEAGDYDWTRTTALPADVLRGVFAAEPNYVDLRSARKAPRAERARLFRALVADLAAPLHHKSKDDLVGEEYTVLRRNRVTAGAAAVALAALTVAATSFALDARRAAENAERQRSAAEEQRTVATSRQLIAQSQVTLATDPRLAFRLGLAAEALRSGPEASANLVHLLSDSPYAGSPVVVRHVATEAAVFAPGGRLLAAQADQRITLWDATDIGRLRQLSSMDGTDAPASMAFSPDGRTLAIAESVADSHSRDHVVTLWDVTDPTVPVKLGVPLTAAGPTVLFGPDSHLLVIAGGKAGATLWDLADRAKPRLITAQLGMTPDGSGSATALSADGGLLATSAGDSVLLWDIHDPSRPRRVGSEIRARPMKVTFSPDATTLAIAEAFSTTRRFDVRDPSRPQEMGPPLPDGGIAVSYSRDGLRMATSNGRTIVVWDVADPARPVRVGDPLGHADTIRAVSFRADGHVLVSAADDAISLWTLDPGARQLGAALTDTGQAVAFTPDGRIVVTATFDGDLLLWDVTDPSRPRRLGPPVRSGTSVARAVAMSADGTLLAFADEFRPMVWLWDISDPARPRALSPLDTGQREDITSAVFTRGPGRVLVTASPDGTAGLWDLRDPNHPRRLSLIKPDHQVSSQAVAAASPDGRILALTVDQGVAQLWDISDPTVPRRVGPQLAEHLDRIQSMAFSPDGRRLVSGGSDGRVLLWDTTDPLMVHRIGPAVGGHAYPVESVEFSRDGSSLAVGRADASALLWDVSDPTHAYRLGPELTGQTDDVSAAFSPDGRLVAVGSVDGTVILWDIGIMADRRTRAHETACWFSGGGLDAPQWSIYVPLPYQESCRV